MLATDDLIREHIQKTLDGIYSQREEILRAFLAKYGCDPDEVVQFEETTPTGTKWWVERKKI